MADGNLGPKERDEGGGPLQGDLFCPTFFFFRTPCLNEKQAPLVNNVELQVMNKKFE